jgi:hypothetical protein
MALTRSALLTHLQGPLLSSSKVGTASRTRPIASHEVGGQRTFVSMYSICATKKLLDRLPGPVEPITQAPSTLLGNWYATAMFRRPHVAVLVNEKTLLPVVMPLAPAKTLGERFPAALAEVLSALEVDRAFIADERARMAEPVFAKTDNRSVIGTLNEFCFMSGLEHPAYEISSPLAQSLWLAQMYCGPLRKSHNCPDLELFALLESLHIAHGANPTHPIGKEPRPRGLATSIPSPDVTEANAKSMHREAQNTSVPTDIQLRVSLCGSDPLIWRRLQVPDHLSLNELHNVLQAVMGWENRHLHAFEIDGERYGPVFAELGEDEQDLDERSVQLHEVLKTGGHLTYEYDFGDSWIHDIEVEVAFQVVRTRDPAVCIDGARACPPEDGGGIERFNEFLEGVVDTPDEEQLNYVEWLGQFNPEAFDIVKVNDRLKRLL